MWLLRKVTSTGLEFVVGNNNFTIIYSYIKVLIYFHFQSATPHSQQKAFPALVVTI